MESVQVIRVMHRTVCHLERIVPIDASILFEAFPEYCLEMHCNGSKLDEIDCRTLQISEIEEFGCNKDAAIEYTLEAQVDEACADAPPSL